MEIHITSTTQVIIALSCYVTVYALIIFMAWALKLKIQSKCCFALLAVIGGLLIIVAGFTGLAFQLLAEDNTYCAKHHKKYTEVTTYAYCQIHHVDTHYNKTIIPTIQLNMNNYFSHIMSQTPKGCPRRRINVLVNNCAGRNVDPPKAVDAVDVEKFREISKYPLCEGKDSVRVCMKKKKKLLEHVKSALYVKEESKD